MPAVRLLAPFLLALILRGTAAADTTQRLPEMPARERQASIVARAREEVERRVTYDPSYVRLTFHAGEDTGRFVYPGGDRDPERSASTCRSASTRISLRAPARIARCLRQTRTSTTAGSALC
jgi:hypothetical protein